MLGKLVTFRPARPVDLLDTVGLVSERRPQVIHKPSLGRLKDARWVVRRPQCRAAADQVPPIGIGVPIVERHEAEGIVANHAARAQSPRAGPGSAA